MVRITINSAVLDSALSDLNRVVDKKAHMPVLLNIRMSIDSTGRISLTARNGFEMNMTKTLQADTFSGSGAFLADAEILSNTLRGLSEQDITLAYDESRASVAVSYIGGSTSFAADDISKWPADAIHDEVKAAIRMQGKTLTAGIARCQYAIGHDDTRPSLCGVFMRREGERLTFAATDGRRLTITDRQLEQGGQDFAAILPERLCNILRASVKQGNQVFVSFRGTYAHFDYGNTHLEAALIEQRYPNVRAVVPVTPPYHIEIDRKTLAASVKRVSLFADKDSQLVVFKLQGNELIVTGRDDTLFSRAITERMDVAKAYASEGGEIPCELQFGLSAKYMLTTLDAFGADMVDMGIIDAYHAVSLLGDSATTILMPMQIPEEQPESGAGEPVKEEVEEEVEEAVEA